ncbi:MAG: DUF4253 domain-containing protein, partial [Gaiellaceae bacterium]
EYYEETHGEWPTGTQPTTSFTGPTEILSGLPLPEVALVVVPADASWHVPCLLQYGDWNECPPAVAHAAILRRWEERYGARVVTMRYDTIELAVDRPIATQQEALVVAHEQYVYCADIVQQGTETIEALAAALLGATVWYFWWD